MSISPETNHKVLVVSLYHARHAARLVQMPSKKEEVVSVFICNGKKLKKSFSSD